MQFHLGRLIDHVHLRVADLKASKRFYCAVLEALGPSDALAEGPGFFHADELFVDKADDYGTRIHRAFQAPDRRKRAFFWVLPISFGLLFATLRVGEQLCPSTSLK